MAKLRKSRGVREVKPGVFEIYCSAGRDPLTGKYRVISKWFYGTFKDAKVARAELLIEVQSGSFSARRVTVDEFVPQWLKELERKNRSVTTIDEYQRRYYRDIQTAIGHVKVDRVTTKMLTDLYTAHTDNGAAPNSVRNIHIIVSSMMAQSCRWGLRKDNPATWAQPPPAEVAPVIVPTPDEVRQLIEGALRSRRPVFAKVIFLVATTGVRRGELCGLRRDHIDWERGVLTVQRSTKNRRRALEPGESRKVQGHTKSRRSRPIAIDARSMDLLRGQIEAVRERAELAGETLIANPWVFTDELDGSDSWDPDSVTQYFTRLRNRLGLRHIKFKSLRAFMDTYSQDLGFTTAQVALRAGHDPSVSSHYTAQVSSTDREIAEALANLLDGAV